MPRRPAIPVTRLTPATVADRLHSAAIHLLRRLRKHDEAMGITAARASALSVAVFGGPVTLGRLAQVEQVSAPTISRLVAAMEEEGLLKRDADEKDKRVVWIRATPKGVRLLTEGRRRRVEAFARELEALDQEHLGILDNAAAIMGRFGSGPRTDVRPTAKGMRRRRER